MIFIVPVTLSLLFTKAGTTSFTVLSTKTPPTILRGKRSLRMITVL